jgi:H+/Cl- antiporter ClcA
VTPLRGLILAAAVGVLAGVGGIGVTLVLHGTQHLLFGYDAGTFLQGIEAAPGWRRVAGAGLGGLLVGLGWAWLRRSGRPATVSDALTAGAPLPIVRTVLDALLQAVAVGGGASVGREGAPRQVGGTAAAQLADRFRLTPVDRRVLVAAGAGGGLAAVYNVPAAGVIFAVLTLATTDRTRPPSRPDPGTRRSRVLRRMRSAAPALRAGHWPVLIVGPAVATVTAWTVLGWGRVYTVPNSPFDVASVTALAIWALVAGPAAAAAAVALNSVARRAMATQPSGWLRAPLAMTAAMGLVGLAAVWWPTLPGNGKGVIELTMNPWSGMRDGVLLAGAALSGWTASAAFLLLIVLKIALTGACLRAGIVGGLLTPALAVGAALGAAAAVAAATAGVPASISEWALVGAAGVLAVSHRSALFALAMVWELTGMPWPVALAAAVAAVLARLSARAAGRG